MSVIGLTGGVGAGKSTVTSIAEKLGATVVSADELGHAVYESGTSEHAAVVEAFGSCAQNPDGSINRTALGEIVFADASQLRRLTDIVWPGIRARALEAITEFRIQRPNGVFMLDAALLLEAKWDELVDQVWVVTASEDERVLRTMQRDGVDRNKVSQRMQSQMSEKDRLDAADVILRNDGDIDELHHNVARELMRLGSN